MITISYHNPEIELFQNLASVTPM